MRKFNLLLLSLAITTILSCKEKDDKAELVVEGVRYYFFVEDQYGNDLLDLKTPNRIDETIIRLYEEIDGEKVLVYNEMSAYPYGWAVARYMDNEQNKHINFVSFSYSCYEFKPNTSKIVYLEWSPGVVDKVECLSKFPEFKFNGVLATEELAGDRVVTKVIQR